VTFDVEALRQREFSWAAAGEALYFNAASTGPLPVRAIRAVNQFTELRGAPHRISHELQFGTLEKSRELIARLVNASPSEIGLATNTSWGINVAAFGLPLGKGDIVIGVDHEFPANIYPWMAAARQRGYRFEILKTERGVPSQQLVLDAIARPGVRALAISWVEFASGYRFDLAELSAACTARNVFLVVDGIQGLGPGTLDLSKIRIDIFACGAQKWLVSPWGTGFTYVRRDLVREIEPGFVSWLDVRNSDDFSRLVEYDLTWRDDARRFEFITLPFQEFAGLNASLELFFELGPAAIENRTRALVERILDWAGRNGVEPATPTDPRHRAGIASLRFDDSAERSTRLNAAKVAHSLREGAIRLAPYFYNTTDEVDRVLEILSSRA
jgi:selenocysteine lyase/cysteine desulfurase